MCSGCGFSGNSIFFWIYRERNFLVVGVCLTAARVERGGGLDEVVFLSYGAPSWRMGGDWCCSWLSFAGAGGGKDEANKGRKEFVPPDLIEQVSSRANSIRSERKLSQLETELADKELELATRHNAEGNRYVPLE
jgi:hypothetical protein